MVNKQRIVAPFSKIKRMVFWLYLNTANKQRIAAKIEYFQKKREKIRSHAEQFFFTDSPKWIELSKCENIIWAKEDQLRDKLLTPALRIEKMIRLSHLYKKEEEADEQIRSLDNVIYKTKEERREALNTALEKETKIKMEKAALEWELMSEYKRAARREMYIISTLKANDLL